jgi:hypothetical protein
MLWSLRGLEWCGWFTEITRGGFLSKRGASEGLKSYEAKGHSIPQAVSSTHQRDFAPCIDSQDAR